MIIISIIKFQKLTHIYIFLIFVGSNLVNFGFFTPSDWKCVQIWEVFYFSNYLITISFLRGEAFSYNFSSSKATTFAYKVDHPKLF